MGSSPEDVAVRDAATVMLLRDGVDGLEVFMVRRSTALEFVGGAYVFPGGGVDETDRHADLEAVAEGLSDDHASALLGIPTGGLAFWVAAVRECFEEAGVLLTYDGAGAIVSLADAAVADRFARHRADVDAGTRSLLDVLRIENLRIAADRIHYFSHWLTPVGPPRRYDTRFFIAAAPEEQEPLHDDRELIAALWTSPADALQRAEAGELQMVLPTTRNLEALSRFAKVGDALAAASSASFERDDG